jgi:hypothetical protein
VAETFLARSSDKGVSRPATEVHGVVTGSGDRVVTFSQENGVGAGSEHCHVRRAASHRHGVIAVAHGDAVCAAASHRHGVIAVSEQDLVRSVVYLNVVGTAPNEIVLFPFPQVTWLRPLPPE